VRRPLPQVGVCAPIIAPAMPFRANHFHP
jgi:hypothetical protein